MSFFEELKRRNVFRVGIAYVIVSWLVLQVVDVVLPMIGLPGTAGQFVLILLLAGFPIALILGWAFEVTPEGIKRDQDVDRSTGITSPTGRRLDFFIIGVLTLAIVFLVFDNYVWVDRPATESTALVDRRYSIAVLPFANRSASADDAYFVDGMHDDILSQLAKLSAFAKVISRTSTEQYRNTTKSIPQIASELGVTTILEGGVQRAAERVRINVQLIDAQEDEHLWSDTYDREMTASNIFDIQSEIATEVSRALKSTLLPGEKERLDSRPTESLEAYEAYLLGRQRLALRTVDAMLDAKALFERAIELDPEFALAWVGIADSVNLLRNYGGFTLNMLQDAEAAIDKALQLDGRLGEAYAALGYLKNQQRLVDESIVSFEKALELSPQYAPAYQWYGNILFETGNADEGLRIRQRGLEIDPLSLIMILETGLNLEGLGRPLEALERYERVLEIDPDWVPGMERMATFHLTYGNKVDGIRWAHRTIAADPENEQILPMMVAAYIDLGDSQKSEFWIHRTRKFGSNSAMTALAELIWSVYRDDHQNVLLYGEELSDRLPRCPDCAIARFRAYVRRGELAAARQAIIDAAPEIADAENPMVSPLNVGTAVELANVLSKLGEHEHASSLRMACFAQIERQDRQGFYGYGINDVALLAQQGKSAEAIDALRQALSVGWNMFWRFNIESPSLDSIRELPEFKSIVQDFEGNMAEQLETIRELENNGELAPIPATIR